MARTQAITTQRSQRIKRSRARIFGTAKRPRLSLVRSNEHIEAQIINDEKGVTLAAVHDREVKQVKGTKEISRRMQVSYEAGKLLADKAKKHKITEVVFDRRGSKYHGRVAAFAKGAREGGLIF